MIVIYAEKASLAKTIATALHTGSRIAHPTEATIGHYEFTFNGEQTVLCHGVGHLCSLADAKSYGKQFSKWDLTAYPCIPDTYKVVIKDKTKNADIIEFLKAYMGFEFKKAGRYYQCKQHNSLVVYADRKGFVWNSQSISGGDTIDFLRKVEGKNFPEAVETIIGEAAPVIYKPAPAYKSEAEQLVLPEKVDGKYSRVFAYMCIAFGCTLFHHNIQKPPKTF